MKRLIQTLICVFALASFAGAQTSPPVINLTAGSHTINLVVDGQTQVSIQVPGEVAIPTPTPATQPAPTPAVVGVVGTNGEGFSYPTSDPVLHPILLQTCQQLHLQVLRLWIEGSFNSAPAASYFKNSLAWSKAGVSIAAVANFQNSAPRCSAPADAQWVNYWNGFPPPSVTGIWAISIGNECNTTSYYNGTNEQLAHLMQLAYPILHGKGYLVIAPSQLKNVANSSQMGQLLKLGAAAWCDAFDTHFYEGTSAKCLADVDKDIVFAATYKKFVIDTEGGVRNSGASLAAQTQQLVAGLRTRQATCLVFPLYLIPSDTTDLAAPLKNDLSVNQPIWDAFNAAMN